jgi:hypothetical protein
LPTSDRLVPALFAGLGGPHVNASDPTLLGADDRYLSDGFHTEETFALLVIRKALERSPVAVANPTSRSAVDSILASPRTNYWYPDFSVTQNQKTVAVDHQTFTARTPAKGGRIGTLR